MKKTILMLMAMLVLASCEHVSKIIDALHGEKEETVETQKPAQASGKTAQATVQSKTEASVNSGKEYPPYGVIYTIETSDEAKRLAYSENRPILIIVGEKTCVMCKSLSVQVVETDQFRKYLADKKIVCVKMWNSLYGMQGRAQFMSKYRPIPDINGEPWLLMAKVVSDSLLGAKPQNLYNGEIELVKSGATDAWWCGSYGHGFEKITGLQSAKNVTEWNAARLIREIDAAFPDGDWD